MRVIAGINNIDTMLKMYAVTMSGPEIITRGEACRNIRNMAVVLDGRTPILSSFRARKLNLNYAKQEWLWYLGADPADDSICQHATLWQKLKQPDGTFFSNYGQYIFGQQLPDNATQFAYVIKCLKADPNTRRASMVLLKPEHLFMENTDVVCTYAINFSIGPSNTLDMTVMMRSNDVVYGFTNDAFCFSQLMEFVYQIMSRHVPGLTRGNYTHITNSMHVYQRHYGMLREIGAHPNGHYYDIVVPRPTPEEVIEIINSNGKSGSGAYYEWLKTVD